MSVIYYCDAPSCGNKREGTSDQYPEDYLAVNVDGVRYDACSDEHAQAVIEANKAPEPEEEDAAEEAEE